MVKSGAGIGRGTVACDAPGLPAPRAPGAAPSLASGGNVDLWSWFDGSRDARDVADQRRQAACITCAGRCVPAAIRCTVPANSISPRCRHMVCPPGTASAALVIQPGAWAGIARRARDQSAAITRTIRLPHMHGPASLACRPSSRRRQGHDIGLIDQYRHAIVAGEPGERRIGGPGQHIHARP